MYMNDSHISEEARNWINTLTVGNHWNVRLLQQKYRVDSTTGERKEMPLRLRRYAEGCPPSCMKAAMDYLLEQAPYTGIVFRGERLDGEYRPTKTEWTYDAGDATNPAAGKNDATFTLVQDLLEVSESDTLSTGSSVNCTEEVTSEWHWDESSVEDIPEAEQGVTWAIQAVNRAEDGTMSYALVKRRALTSHMESTLSKSTTTEKVWRETWKNLYGEPGAFKDDSGASVTVPDPYGSGGVALEVQIQKNDDCTYDAVATKTQALNVQVKASSTHDQYKGEHSVSTLGAASPLGIAPDASGGVIRKFEDQVQPDGKYSTQEETVVERPVSESKVEISIGRKGKRTTRVDTNQPARPAAPTKVGERVSFEKTPGKLYTVTTSTWDRNKRFVTGESCKEDVFEHDHTTMVAGDNVTPDGDTHVEGSGVGGHVKTRSVETDDDGAVTVSERDALELPVSNHKQSWRVTRTGIEHQVTDTHQAKAETAPVWGTAKIGETVSTEITPGGLHNNTRSEYIVPAGLDSALGLSCTKTIFEHTDKATSVVADQTLTDHADDAGDGVYTEETRQLNDDSTKSVIVTTHRELTKSEARKSVRRTAKAVITTTVEKNARDKTASTPSAIGTVEHSYNPGGTTDYTVTTAAIAGGVDRAACSKTVFEHHHESQSVAIATTADTSDSDVTAGNGTYLSKVSTVDDYGVRTNTTTKVDEITVSDAKVEYRKTPRYLVTSKTVKNSSTPASAPAANGGASSHSMNPGGSYDVTTVTYSVTGAKDRADGVRTADAEVRESQVVVDKNSVGTPWTEVPAVTVGTSNSYKRRTEVIDDSTGIRTVTEQETVENEVSDFKVDQTATHFVTTTARTTRHGSDQAGSEDLDPVEKDGDGEIKSYSYSVNPGGTIDCTETSQKAQKDSWYEPTVEDFRSYRVVFHFRNFKYSDYQTEYNKIAAAFKAKLTGWGNAGTAPTTVSVNPSSNLNDYGLFDGTITVDASWSPGTAAPGDDANAVFTDKTFTSVSVSQNQTVDSNGTTHVTAGVQSVTYRYIVARGDQLWDNLCYQYRTHLDGSSFNYSYSGPFSIIARTAVKKATVAEVTGQNAWNI